jgi:hypothetical protein
MHAVHEVQMPLPGCCLSMCVLVRNCGPTNVVPTLIEERSWNKHKLGQGSWWGPKQRMTVLVMSSSNLLDWTGLLHDSRAMRKVWSWVLQDPTRNDSAGKTSSSLPDPIQGSGRVTELWEKKIWSWVLRDPEPRMTDWQRSAANYQTRSGLLSVVSNWSPASKDRSRWVWKQ